MGREQHLTSLLRVA